MQCTGKLAKPKSHIMCKVYAFCQTVQSLMFSLCESLLPWLPVEKLSQP